MQPMLQEALAQWRALLGEGAVLPALAASQRYGRSISGTHRRVAAALQPRARGQIAPIVEIAARCRVPLYPISTGRNWGYGDASPVMDDGVVLDLSRIDRIVALDAELGTVTLEPGVTQGQLHAYLAERGLPFMVPTTGAGPTVSLVGNALERGYGVTPHADHFGAVMALEAVLPDGSLYRSRLTRLGAERADRGYKWGVGPYVDGLFSQGGLGVVTQMTLALAHRPPHVEAFFVFLKSEECVGAAVAALQGVLRTVGGMLGGVNLLNAYRLASMSCSYPHGEASAGNVLSPQRVEHLLRQHRLGPGLLMGSVYGERATAKAALSAIRRAFKPFSSRQVVLTRGKAAAIKALADRFPGLARRVGLTQVDRMLRGLNLIEGIPDELALNLVYWTSPSPVPAAPSSALGSSDRGLIWYAPLVPMVPSVVTEFQAMVRRVCLAHGFEPLITLTSLSDRCFDSSVPILFDRSSAEETARAHECFDALFEAGQALGLLPYRVGIHGHRKLDPSADGSIDLAQRIKQCIDPGRLISPGRYEAGAVQAN